MAAHKGNTYAVANSKSFLTFQEVEYPKKKTKTFVVRSARGNECLGLIKWYAPWRRYTFSPANGTLFDSGCMKEVTTQIDSLMAERKQN